MDKETQIYSWAAGCGAFFILMLLLSWAYDKPATPPPPAAVVKPRIPAPPKPAPTKAQLRATKLAQEKAIAAQQKAQAESLARALACRELGSRLVNSGYDVDITLMSDNNRNMVIYGPGVSRLMARQMATRSSAQRLKSIGFTKVTFMRSQYDWVGEWDVFYNTIRLSGD